MIVFCGNYKVTMTTNNKEIPDMKNDILKYSNCPIQRSMAILGSKWKPIIIYTLRDRKARFGQLHASIGHISRKVLTDMLRELEHDEIILRQEFKEIPPRVEYHLTEKGKALIPIMTALTRWDDLYSRHHEAAQTEKVSGT